MKRIVYACDIGSTKPKTNSFGWVRSDLKAAFKPAGSANIDELVNHLTKDLGSGASVALGFEAPLFMPVPDNSDDLSCARDGEGNRSMFAPAGGYVTTLACHQIAFILNKISSFKSTHDLILDEASWKSCKKPTILLWEAFVSGKEVHAPKGNHIGDAATAAHLFHMEQKSLEKNSSVTTSHDCFSILGAVAIWSGWLKNKSALKKKCLVLRPTKRYKTKVPSIQRLKGNG